MSSSINDYKKLVRATQGLIRIDRVRELLERGVNPNDPTGKEDNYWTPLGMAIAKEANSSKEVAELLLRYGANPQPALRNLLRSRLPDSLIFERLKLLLDFDVDMKKALSFIDVRRVRGGKFEFLDYLMEVGADPSYGLRWVHEPDIMQYSIREGADPNIRFDDGTTPLYKLLALSYQGGFQTRGKADLETIKLLINAGADVNERNRYTLLNLAIENQNPSLPIVELLIDAGADVNAVNERGQTALGAAILAGKPDVVKLLLENGADPNLRSRAMLGRPEKLLPMELVLWNFGAEMDEYLYAEDMLRLLWKYRADPGSRDLWERAGMEDVHDHLMENRKRAIYTMMRPALGDAALSVARHIGDGPEITKRIVPNWQRFWENRELWDKGSDELHGDVNIPTDMFRTPSGYRTMRRRQPRRKSANYEQMSKHARDLADSHTTTESSEWSEDQKGGGSFDLLLSVVERLIEGDAIFERKLRRLLQE